MARKTRKQASETQGADAPQALRDSAQKIWLAGLGAFERARSEGPKVFETLVGQGRSMGARAAGAADEAVKSFRAADYGGQLEKLEQVLEERIAKSLQRLGVITSHEVDALSKQVQDLNATVQNLMASSTRAPRKPGASRATGPARKKAGARKASAKKATRR